MVRCIQGLNKPPTLMLIPEQRIIHNMVNAQVWVTALKGVIVGESISVL